MKIKKPQNLLELKQKIGMDAPTQNLKKRKYPKRQRKLAKHSREIIVLRDHEEKTFRQIYGILTDRGIETSVTSVHEAYHAFKGTQKKWCAS